MNRDTTILKTFRFQVTELCDDLNDLLNQIQDPDEPDPFDPMHTTLETIQDSSERVECKELRDLTGQMMERVRDWSEGNAEPTPEDLETFRQILSGIRSAVKNVNGDNRSMDLSEYRERLNES